MKIFFLPEEFISKDFQNLQNLYLEVNIFASKFQLIVTLTLLLPSVRDVRIRTFSDQICGLTRHNEEVRDWEASGFCKVQKLT